MGSVSTVLGGVLRTPAYERGASGSLGLNGLLAVMLLVGIKAKAGGKGWRGLGGGSLVPAFSGWLSRAKARMLSSRTQISSSLLSSL